MSASIPQIVGKQVRVMNIKALPDEIFGLIKQWLLPVKPKVCGECEASCAKTHIMKSSPGMQTYYGLQTRPLHRNMRTRFAYHEMRHTVIYYVRFHSSC